MKSRNTDPRHPRTITFPVPLAVDNGEPNQGSAFGYEAGLFSVFDEQEELLAAASLPPRLYRSAQSLHPDCEHD